MKIKCLILLLLLPLLLVLLVGCKSFRTAAIDRSEIDCLIVNPDQPMNGVPVTLRVPTHLELNVIETTYWEKRDRSNHKPTLVPVSTCRPTRKVEHRVCYTERVFLVDPARPAAGTQSYGFTFKSKHSDSADDAGKGYLDKVAYKIDDRTITETASRLTDSLSLISGFNVSANRALPNRGNLVATSRTVAFARFDINSASFESDVEAFLDIHVNQPLACTRCPEVCEPAVCELPQGRQAPVAGPSPNEGHARVTPGPGRNSPSFSDKRQ